MNHLRRTWIAVLISALLAACAPAAAPSPTTAPAQPAARPTTAPTTVSGAKPTMASPATAPAPSPAAATPAPSPAAAASPAASPAAAFPATIEHKFGRTTIPAAPTRVVALGFTDQDSILALGVVPVAVRDFFGNQPDAVWPWARDRLGSARPQVLNMPFGQLDVEAIAALQPDLIVAVSAGLKREEYDRLSQIAPTVSQSDQYVDFGVPWQEQTRVIGRALGREQQALRLIAETEARFAAVRTSHPEFAGKTAAIAAPAGDGNFFVSGPQHERQRFLTALGFTLPDALARIAGDAFYGTISGEQIQLLDTDVLLWLWQLSPEQRAAIENNPLYQQLKVAREGRAIFLDSSRDTDLAGPALVFSSVLSIPTALDLLVPRLDAALGSNPATRVAP